MPLRKPSARLNFLLPAHYVAIFKRRSKQARMSMTDYFIRCHFSGLGAREKKPKLANVVPNFIVELHNGQLAYVIDRDGERVFVLRRGTRGWDEQPVEYDRSEIRVEVAHDDPRRRGFRRPRRYIRAALLKLVQHCRPNTFKPKPPSRAEELAMSPDERLRAGLCLACGGKIDPVRKKRGFHTCERCGKVD